MFPSSLRAQVHRAVLKDGREVVVKVQYPDAERHFRIDMTLFLWATRIFAPGFAEILAIFERNFANEFDYRREAELQLTVEAAVAESAELRGKVQVPRAYRRAQQPTPF